MVLPLLAPYHASASHRMSSIDLIPHVFEYRNVPCETFCSLTSGIMGLTVDSEVTVAFG